MIRQADSNTLEQVACCIVLDDANRLLLLKRASHKPGGGLWALPAGKIEDNESSLQAAMRELREESGLLFMPEHFKSLGTHMATLPHGTVMIKSFFIPSDGRQTVIINDENEEFTWAPLPLIHTTTELIWGIPTMLNHFGFINLDRPDHTLLDGSTVALIEQN